MGRLTKRTENGITYTEKKEIECSVYCDGCIVGAAQCKTLKRMIERLAEYEDVVEWEETI